MEPINSRAAACSRRTTELRSATLIGSNWTSSMSLVGAVKKRRALRLRTFVFLTTVVSGPEQDAQTLRDVVQP
eukprot:1639584-Prymnesium_polylepis.1